MSENVRIIIEIGPRLTTENHEAIKTMLDAYVGQFIKTNSFPTSNNQFADRQINNDINFVISFNKIDQNLE